MPKKQKINLAKVLVLINTPTFNQKCGFSIPPEKQLRVDSVRVECH